MSVVARLIGPVLVGAITFFAAHPSCSEAQGNVVMRRQSGPYELQVLVDGGIASSFYHRGEDYILGHLGERYTLRIINRSGRRVEAVVSVDGLDVLDGRDANYRTKRGYLVGAWDSVDIDGWRLSTEEVAAFRFSSVPESYAARTGSDREVGVIGVAIFPERIYRPRPAPVVIPDHYYDDHPYYPQRRGPRSEGRSRDSSAPAAESPAPTRPRESSAARSLSGAVGGTDMAQDRAYGYEDEGQRRSGLGTEFGERRYSSVHNVRFVRASSSSPATILGLRYNDREGLLALGINVDGYPYYSDDDVYLRRTALPFPNNGPRYAEPPAGW